MTVVPAPASAQPATGVSFPIRSDTVISTDAPAVGEYLAAALRHSTGYPLPVRPATGVSGGIELLLLTGAPASVGDEGYQLDVTAKAVVLRARRPAGLFEGVQTLRQLLPSKVESATVQPGPSSVPGGHVVDFPRFPYRGAMLDVARHFFTVAQVERYIDQVARCKVNRFHLFPRLPAIAELGWSPQATHSWGAFKQRLAAQGPRWKVLGINYYHSTQVPWPAGA